MKDKSKDIEEELEKLNSLRAFYRRNRNKILKNERDLKYIRNEVVIFERQLEKERMTPGILKKLQTLALEQIKSSVYIDSKQRDKDIQKATNYYDVHFLREGIKKRKPLIIEMEKILTEFSDYNNFKVRKEIRKIEKRIRKINQNLLPSEDYF
ncbi:MAG: hypothetical protein ACFFAI_02820 [Promethearchaeota archaeon]